MKIIAVCSDREVLVQMSPTEIEYLSGVQIGCIAQRDIGREFDIRKSWAVIRHLEQHREELPRIANRLRALADILEPIQVEIPTGDETKT